MKSSRYPLDFDALKKGDVVTIDQLEQIIGKERGTDAFRLGLRALIERTKEELDDLHGTSDQTSGWFVVEKRGQMRILTDAEAVDYWQSEELRARRLQARTVHRAASIDVGNLNEKVVERHRQRLLRAAWRASMQTKSPPKLTNNDGKAIEGGA